MDMQKDLQTQITELREHLQHEREERHRDLKLLRQDLSMIITSLKAAQHEPEIQYSENLTQVKELWKKESDKTNATQKFNQSGFSMMTYLFGITSADFKTGQIGSKAIHPSSRFSMRE
jgi:hypothetical protein